MLKIIFFKELKIVQHHIYHDGEVLATIFQKLYGQFDTEVAQAMVVVITIKLVVETGFWAIQVEGDAQLRMR